MFQKKIKFLKYKNADPKSVKNKTTFGRKRTEYENNEF